MKKRIRFIIVTILLIVCSGCFPVFVPVDDGGRRGDGGRGGGEHRDDDHGEHRDYR